MQKRIYWSCQHRSGLQMEARWGTICISNGTKCHTLVTESHPQSSSLGTERCCHLWKVLKQVSQTQVVKVIWSTLRYLSWLLDSATDEHRTYTEILSHKIPNHMSHTVRYQAYVPSFHTEETCVGRLEMTPV